MFYFALCLVFILISFAIYIYIYCYIYTVSLCIRPSHQLCWDNYSIAIIGQIAQHGVPASVSALASVAHVKEHNPSVSCLQLCFSSFLLMISRLGTLNSFLLALRLQVLQLLKQLALL